MQTGNDIHNGLTMPDMPPITVDPTEEPTRLAMPAIDGRERRRADRVALHVDVDLASESNFYTGFVQNISAGGLFVATRDLVPIGREIQISFTVPGHEPTIDVTCEVRWQRLEQLDSVDSTPGIGVRFLDLRPDDQAAINRFLDERESLFFDDE